jgi:chromosome segregation ATPase
LPSITADEVVKLFEGDVRARKRLAELLVSEPDVRLAIINAVLRDVATKSDIEALRVATKSDIESLRATTKSDIEALRGELRSNVEALRKEFRSDVEYLRKEFKEDIGRLDKGIDGLDGRIGSLEQRVAKLEGSISLFTKLFVAFNLPLLVSVIVALVALLLKAP